MWLRVNLQATTPLAFRAGRNPAHSDTLKYVPGPSLLGGLAQAHQYLGRDKTEFAMFFLREHIRFGNCYPAHFHKDSKLQSDLAPVWPMPTTARSCKRFSGFQWKTKDDDRDKREGVTDALIPLALFALSAEERYTLLSFLDAHEHDNHSAGAEPFDAMSGFFRRGSSAEMIGQPEQSIQLRTHTGINYRTGTVQQAILYSRQSLGEGQQFWGQWWVDDALSADFQVFVDEASQSGMIRLGTSRSRGAGGITCNLMPYEPDSSAALQQRVEQFSALLQAEAVKAAIPAPAALYVPLLCSSDVILHDPLGRARLQIHAEDLGVPGLEDATLVLHSASVKHVQSWSSVWGLPKADDWAIGMGSVFLLAFPQADTATFAALWQLQQQGIGQRRAEGFGMVSVANQVHLDLAGGQLR